jgi:hypothetical protein
MSAAGNITFEWADGEYTFRLGLREIRLLQEKTGLGPLALFRRIQRDEWRIDDLRETLRLGLIGAGMDDMKALALVKNHFDDRPKVDAKEPAMKIIGAFLVGVPDDPLGKQKAAEGSSGAMESSPSPPSTGLGAAIGFTPEQVDGMTLWQLKACAEGWRLAHRGGHAAIAPPTDEEYQAFINRNR